MKQFAEKVKVTVFETNEKGEMKQNVRNAFKAECMKAFAETMKANGVEVKQVADGMALTFENEVEGSVTVVFDGTVKSFSFDVDFENADFVEKQNAKVAKAEKVAAEKALKVKAVKVAKVAKA